MKRFNLNNSILVKLTDEGIRSLVMDHNSVMPFDLQVSFREYKKRADKNGYHRFQAWDFINILGGKGMKLSQFITGLDIIIDHSDLREFKTID